MTIDSANEAVYDPSVTNAPLLRPIKTMDSAFLEDRSGIAVRRGHGERLVVYFRVDPRFACTGAARVLTVNYRDEGTGSWFAEYVSMSTSMDDTYPWTSTERIGLLSSGEQRSARLELPDARWTGAFNGADFRIVVVDSALDQLRIDSLSLGNPPGTSGDTNSARLGDRYVFPSDRCSIAFSQPENTEASIIIPVFNELPYTLSCLRSVLEFTPPIYEILVVDNGSTDSTAETLAAISGLRVITNTSNLGFARACNIGAVAARGDWLVFLNNDTIVQPGWLTALIECVRRNEKAGAIGCKLVFPQSGEVQCAGVSFSRQLLPVEDYRYCDPMDPAVRIDRKVDAVSGACLLTPRRLFMDMEGLDEHFMNGFEDVDYCLRLKKKHLESIYCASSIVLHYQSATEGRYDIHTSQSNVALFYKKWHSFLTDISYERKDPTIRAQDTTLRFDAQSSGIRSQTGVRLRGRIECIAGKHAAGHCFYGPNIRVADDVTVRIRFVMEILDIYGPDELVSLDVYDSLNDRVLHHETIASSEASVLAERSIIDTRLTEDQIVEFRAYWHGSCDLVVSHVELEIEPTESDGT